MRKGKMPPVPYGGWVVSVWPDWCPSALLRVPHQPGNPRITGLVLTPNQKASGEATNVLSLSGETKNHSAEPRVREGMLRNFQVHIISDLEASTRAAMTCPFSTFPVQ